MGQIIGLISLKGGVGKTTISSALAANLANNHGKKVLLVDANYSAPNLGLHMDIIAPEGSLHDVLNGARFSSAIHDRYGVDVIPGNFMYSRNIDPLRLKSKLKQIKDKYDYVIIDSSPSLNEEVLSAMLASDKLFVVSTPDYPTLSCSMKAAKLAKNRSKPIAGIILNRVSDPFYEISLEEIQESTDIPVVARLKEDNNVKKALFKRVPVTLSSQNSKFSREIDRLSMALIGKEEKSFFNKIFAGSSFRKAKANREVLREDFYKSMFE